MTRLALALITLALVMPAAAEAATWTKPDLVTPLSLFRSDGGPQFADDGSGLAVFTQQGSGEAHSSSGYTGRTDLTRSPGGAWTARFSAATRKGLEPLGQTVSGSGDVVLIGSVILGPEHRATGLAVRYGKLDADGVSYGRRQPLVANDRFGAYDLAGNHAGDAAAAWSVPRGPRNGRGVYVARREQGDDLGDPARVATRAAVAGTLEVAVGPGGHTVVVWRRGNQLFARFAPPGGRFGEPTKVGNGRPSALAVAAGRKGRAIVAWKSGRTNSLVVALRGKSGGFRRRPPEQPGGAEDIHVAFGAEGLPLVAFTTDLGPEVVTYESGVVSSESLAFSGSVADLAVSPGGRAAVSVLTKPSASSHRTVRVFVRRRATDTFGAGETASPDDQTIGEASIGFDPLTEQPSLLYLEFPGDPPNANIYAVERKPG